MNENVVFCRRLKQEKEALLKAPLAGPVGQLILNNVSAEAYNDWLETQIKIINEERLDLSEVGAQERLFGYMVSFLNLEDLVE